MSAFIPPAHYEDSAGRPYCAHAVPVAPGSCSECHALTDEHWDTGCTCTHDEGRAVSSPAHECAAGCGQPLTEWQRSVDDRVWHRDCVPPGLPLRTAAPRRPATEPVIDTITPGGGLL